LQQTERKEKAMGIYGSLAGFVAGFIPGDNPIVAIKIAFLLASVVGIGLVLLLKKGEQGS